MNIEQIAEIIDKLQCRLAISIEHDLWDAAMIAAYLKVGKPQVLARYAPLPGFPQAIRLPVAGGGKGQPRWKAKEIIAWAEKHQEKRAA